ncbi:hAT transposon family protein [Methanosarcina sp.]|uniref:hAT transposon family protein n=1 Tax=Methanosarcina sp. TaxID=2213 RepID=UPI003BB5C746
MTNFFGVLEPKNIVKLSEAEILKLCDKFEKQYPEVISSEFHMQLLHAISIVKNELKENMSIKTFADLLLTKYSCLESDFSEIYTAFMLFFTLPVTVASVERTFRKLKMIKDYKRNSIGQTRLRDLAILSIEHAEADRMDLKELISDFANMKARKNNSKINHGGVCSVPWPLCNV